MRKEQILGDGIFTIHDFLSPEECETYIARSEQRGYEDAPLATLFGPMVRHQARNNMRLTVDDPNLAREWFERAQQFLPAQIDQWKLTGFNERFRFYRYDPGQTFTRHYDASYRRPNGETSFLTFMVYLNEGFVGGMTAFYHANDQPKASVLPKRGMALVFDHQQVHEGAVVESGRKYVLRTDVMYRRTR